MADRVTIRHPDQDPESTAIVSRKAFDGTWAGKGFEIVDEDEGTTPAISTTPRTWSDGE